MKQTQVLLIHGGETFKNQKDYLNYLKTRRISLEKRISWSGDYLDEKLGPKFQVIRPRMPFQENAKYAEWKINFERYIPLLKNDLILIGNSLGGIFLAKYLSEHKFPKKIKAVFLVCPPFDDTLEGEDLVNGFKLKSDLSLLEKQAKNLNLLFSADDQCVPVSHAEKYQNKLSNCNIVIYQDKNGHFNVPTFPEIVEMIKEA